jgi:hypothetical protein
MGTQTRVGTVEAPDSDPSAWMDETLPLELRRELLEKALRSLRSPMAKAHPEKPPAHSTDHPGQPDAKHP